MVESSTNATTEKEETVIISEAEPQRPATAAYQNKDEERPVTATATDAETLASQQDFYGRDAKNADLEGVEDNEAEEMGKKKNKKKKNRKRKKKDVESNVSVERSQEQNDAPPTLNDQRNGEPAVFEEDPDFTPLKQKLNESFFEDRDSSEDEGMPDYKLGGYHPIHVGEILIDRYVIIQKLGWGHFSTVWLTKDLKYNSYVAIKVQKSAQHYLEAAYDEVDILHQVSTNWKSAEWEAAAKEYYKNDPDLMASLKKLGHSGETSHCVQLLNSFIHNGPNGKHFVMVFEILGVNFLELIKRYEYKGVPIPLVRKLARQCLIGLDYMHRMCRIIHTDFKPENVVIGLRDEEVAEIAQTGQLTTTKMFDEGAAHIRKLNMKVAGTLPRREEKKTVEPEKEEVKKDCLEGLTKKQKQNLKKKLARKRKKLQATQSQIQGTEPSECDKEESSKNVEEDDEVGDIEIDLDDVAVKKDSKPAPKKQAAGSVDRDKHEVFKGLIDSPELPVKNEEDEEKSKMKRGPGLRDDVQVKICDMGNGCWTYKHFTPEIQTRQYRSPEVIIGAQYNTSADIWSFACTIFEMITGDFLFEPRTDKVYDKDDDHLAQMMELLGQMPTNLALSGKNSNKFFNRKGALRRISGLNYWPLKKVLTEKYLIREDEAQALNDFLLPMLDWHHDKRASAEEMLKHPWLDMAPNYDFKYSEVEYQKLQLKKQMKQAEEEVAKEKPQEMGELVESDCELYYPDEEDDCTLTTLLSTLEGKVQKVDSRPNETSMQKKHDIALSNVLSSDSDESLQDELESKAERKERKAREATFNNSYTGPYPLDPTEFLHTDKGANAQFLHYNRLKAAKEKAEEK